MLNFIYCLDKNYNFQALTSINSLLEAVSEKIKIFIIHDEPETMDLSMLKNSNMAEIYKYKIDTKNIDFPNLKGSHVSKATYFRMFISKFLPTDLDFIIYMDSDIICLNNPLPSIKKTVQKLKSSSFTVAARTEFDLENSINGDNERFDKLDLKGDKYFNAGVLVLDYQFWINEQIEKKLFKILNKYYEKIKFWDQDVLNKFYDGKYYELDNNLNYEFAIFNKDKFNEDYINNNVKFLHFNGKGKPWDSKNIFFDSSLFYQSYFRKIHKDFYHIVVKNNIKSTTEAIKILVSGKFLKLEKPFTFFILSLKAIFKIN